MAPTPPAADFSLEGVTVESYMFALCYEALSDPVVEERTPSGVEVDPGLSTTAIVISVALYDDMGLFECTDYTATYYDEDWNVIGNGSPVYFDGVFEENGDQGEAFILLPQDAWRVKRIVIE